MNTETQITITGYESIFNSVPILTHKMLNPMEVRVFFMTLYCVLRLDFNPDDEFVPNEDNYLSASQCATLNQRMDEAHDICTRYEIDINEIASHIAIQLGIMPGFETTFPFNTPDEC